MLTVQRINRLAQDQVLEGLGEHEGDTLRVVVAHTSPSHYEAVGEFRLRSGKLHRPCSGPMTPDLLVEWLETLLERWPSEQTVSWATHPLDEKTLQFIRQAKEPHKVG